MGADQGRIRILIVDDNPNFRRLLGAILSAIPTADVAEASNGDEALEVLRSFIPSIILVDWRMHGMDGAEFIRYVRSNPDSPNPLVPIVVVTGYPEGGLAQQIRDVGADDFVVKPVSPRALLGRILRVLQSSRPYVRAGNYVGPDRRRKTESEVPEERRKRESLSAKVHG